jgi:DGQHR domain-containing protein
MSKNTSRKKSKGKSKSGGKRKVNLARHRQEVAKTVSIADNSSIVPDEFRNKDATYFEIGVIKKSQRGYDTFSGEMSLATLATVVGVDRYNGEDAEAVYSCQRSKTEIQGKKFGDFISDSRNVCLADILINDREKKVEFISLRQLGIEIPTNRKIETTHGILRIPSDSQIFAYDGQTRRFGYLTLLHYDESIIGAEMHKEYKNLNIPFTLSQVPGEVETQFFLNHNGRQTTVPSDHRAMVSHHANKNGKVITNQTNAEFIYSIVAGTCYNLVNNRSNPWFKKITMPDTSKHEERSGSICSFNTGLKHIVSWMNKEYWSPETLEGAKSEELAEICATYWNAVKRTCPKIFRNPDDYVMTTSQGISSLSLLMQVLFKDFFSTDTKWNIENISAVLKKSSLMTTPKKWIKGGEISKRGGGYKALAQLQVDIYMQTKR